MRPQVLKVALCVAHTVAARTGIAFGSLYQYFPDKTAIIGTLAERYNAIGHECVRRELTHLKELRDLYPVLCRLTDSYYQFFLTEPIVHCIWQATQADRDLQKLDKEDVAFLATLLSGALRRAAPKTSRASLSAFAQVVMVLISAVVRHAIALPRNEGREVLELFKRVLPKDLSTLKA